MQPHPALLKVHLPQRHPSGLQAGYAPSPGASPTAATSPPIALEQAPSDGRFAELLVFGLPSGSTHGSLATFFRGFYPSVHSAKVWAPLASRGEVCRQCASVRFMSREERDAAAREVSCAAARGWAAHAGGAVLELAAVLPRTWDACAAAANLPRR